MARCQTHASLNKMHAFLLLIPFPAVSAPPSHSTLGWDGKEDSDSSGERDCVKWFYSWICILYVIKINMCMHAHIL